MSFTQFQGWSPDLDPTTQGVITDLTSVVPVIKGYKTAPANVSAGYPALSATCQGAALAMKLDGTYKFYAGIGTKLYEGSGLAWTDRSRVGAYTIASDQQWCFTQYGDTTIATDKADAIQYSTGGAFADIPTSPVARLCETISGFVMLADTNNGTSGTTYGDQSDRWWCSSYLDATSGTAWTPSVTTQCTTGRLVDVAGPIRSLKRLGNTIIAYKDKGIFVGRYVGAPAVFQWDLVPGDIGAPSQGAVASIGTAHYFIGYENIYYFDGSRPIPIGNDLKNWFFADLNKAYRYRIVSGHDRQNSQVWFFYPNNSSTGQPNAAIVYNYVTNKWGRGDRSIETVVDILTGAMTYDSLGSYFSTYDSIPTISYDSPFFSQSSPILSVFSTDHAPYTLSGSGSTATIVTGEFGDDALYSTLYQVRPRFVSAPTSATAYEITKSVSGGSTTSSATSSLVDGKFDFLTSARWHKVSMTLTGDMTITGFNADMRADGYA